MSLLQIIMDPGFAVKADNKSEPEYWSVRNLMAALDGVVWAYFGETTNRPEPAIVTGYCDMKVSVIAIVTPRSYPGVRSLTPEEGLALLEQMRESAEDGQPDDDRHVEDVRLADLKVSFRVQLEDGNVLELPSRTPSRQ